MFPQEPQHQSAVPTPKPDISGGGPVPGAPRMFPEPTPVVHTPVQPQPQAMEMTSLPAAETLEAAPAVNYSQAVLGQSAQVAPVPVRAQFEAAGGSSVSGQIPLVGSSVAPVASVTSVSRFGQLLGRLRSWQALDWLRAGVATAGVVTMVGGAAVGVHKITQTEPLEGQPISFSQVDLSSSEWEVTFNGKVNVQGSMVLKPGSVPSDPVQGQIFVDENGNLQYFNGEKVITLSGDANVIRNQLLQSGQSIEQIVEQTGLTLPQIEALFSLLPTGSSPQQAGQDTDGDGEPDIVLGGQGSITSVQSTSSNLTVEQNAAGVVTLSWTDNPAVESISGVRGAIDLSRGLAIIGQTLRNTGVLSVANVSGDLALGTGLAISGNVLYNTGVLVVEGTENQVIATNEGGEIVLSLPQDIATDSTPEFNSIILLQGLGVVSGGTGRTSLDQNGVLIGNGTSPVQVVTTDDPNKCLISTSGAPSFQTCPGAVDSVNGLIGSMTIRGPNPASPGVTTFTDGFGAQFIVIPAASSTTAGLASFNTQNFVIGSFGSVNLAQDLHENASPTFNSLTLDVSALDIASGGTGLRLTGPNLPKDGELLIGNGSGFSLTTLTAGDNIVIENEAGIITISSPLADTCSSCANLNLSNLQPTSINQHLIPQMDSENGLPLLDLGSQGTAWRDIYIGGTSTASGGSIKLTASPSTPRTITFPDTDGTVAVKASGNIALSAAGEITFFGQLVVSQGGTGAATAEDARANLGAAASGANDDITSLTGVSQIGTALSDLVFTSSTTQISVTDGTNTATLTFEAPTANVTYRFPAAASGTYDVCTTAGNCTGGGGLISGGGTAGRIVMFDDAQNIVDSIMLQSGSSITLEGSAEVQQGITTNTIQAINPESGTASLTVGSTSQNLTLQGENLTLVRQSTTGFSTTLNFASATLNGKTITFPNNSGTVAVEATGPIELSSTGVISCATCVTGGTVVTSVNGMTENINVVATDNQTTVTTDTTLGRKWVVVGTVQNIATTSAPTFAGLTVSGTLGVQSLSVTNGGSFGQSVSVGGSLTVTEDVSIGGNLTIAGDFSAASFNGIELEATGDGFTVAGGTSQTTLTVAPTSLTLTQGVDSYTLNLLADITLDQDLGIAASPTFAGLTLTAPLAVSSGGTGLNTAPTNGQLLIGNGTSYTLATLTAGNGIAITNGAGSITLEVDNPGICNTCANRNLSNLQTTALNMDLLPGATGTLNLGSASARFANVHAVTGNFDNVVAAGTTFTNNVQPIDEGDSLTVGSVTNDLTLQGTNTKLTSSAGLNTATLTFETPTASYTYRLLDAPTGVYDICTSRGNCNNPNMVTGSGTSGRLTRFTGTNSVGNSVIYDNGSVAGVGELGATAFHVLGDINATLSLMVGGNTVCTADGCLADPDIDLQSMYTSSVGNTTPEIKLDTVRGALDIQDADSTIAGNLFNVRSSNALTLGTILFGVGNTGQVTVQTTTNTTSALRVLNNDASATVLAVDTQNRRVGVGNTAAPTATLQVSSSDSGSLLTVTSAAGTPMDVFTVANTGAVVFKTKTNAVAGVQIQNNDNSWNLTVDTQNGRVGIGNATPGYALDVTGEINATTGLRINGTQGLTATCTGSEVLLTPVLAGGVLTGGTCSVPSGAATNLQGAYSASNGGTVAEIKLDSTVGTIDIQDADVSIAANLLNVRASNNSGLGDILFGVSSTGQVAIQNTVDSTAAFTVTNASDVAVFKIDTANDRITVTNLDPLNNAAIYQKSTDPIEIGNYTHMAAGQDGFARMVYTEGSSSGPLKFARCTDAACASPVITTITANTTLLPYVTIAADGFARISYMNTTTGQELYFTQCTNDDCTTRNTTMVDTTWTGTGFYSAVAMGNDGFARIAYYDTHTGVRDLHYAQCLDAACTTSNKTTVDATNDTGQTPDIEIGNDGFARITYSDATGNDLKYAQCTNDACTTKTLTTLDTAGSSGVNASLELGADGFGRIAYYTDSTTVKYLQCINDACTSPTIRTIANTSNTVTRNRNSLEIGTDGKARITYIQGLTTFKLATCSDDTCASFDSVTVDDTGDAYNMLGLILDNANWPSFLYTRSNNELIFYPLPGASGTFIGRSDNYFAQAFIRDIQTSGLSVEPVADNETALQVNNASGTGYFVVDTTGDGNITTTNLTALNAGVTYGHTVSAGLDSNQVSSTDIAIGPDGFPRIAYSHTSRTFKFVRCHDAACSASTITTVHTVASPNSIDEASIVMGNDGFARMAFIAGQNPAYLYYIQCTNADCTTRNTVSLDGPVQGGNLDMMLGSDGFVRIAYRQFWQTGSTYPYAVKYVVCNNDACSAPTVSFIDDITDQIGVNVKMAQDSNGLPRIVSENSSAPTKLRYMYCNDENCVSRSGSDITLSTPGNGGGPTIAIAPDNMARITYYYYDGTNYKLAFIQCLNVGCSSTTTPQIIGESIYSGPSPILYDEDGIARIVYSKNNGDTIMVKCLNADCSSRRDTIFYSTTESLSKLDISQTIGSDGLSRVAFVQSGTTYSLHMARVGGTTGTKIGSVSNYYGSAYVRNIYADGVNIQPTVDNSEAFKIQNSTGTTLLNVDTTNLNLSVGASAVFKNAGDSAAAFQVQTAAGSTVLSVNNNQIPNSSFEENVSGWALRQVAGTPTISSSTDYALYGSRSLKLETSTSNGNGVAFGYAPKSNTTYTFSFWARKNSGTASAFKIGRTDTVYTTGSARQVSGTALSGSSTGWTADMVGSQVTWGGVTDVITGWTSSTAMTVATSRSMGTNYYSYVIQRDIDCLTNQTMTTSWTKYSCTFTTGSSFTNPQLYIKQSDTGADTIYIDGVTLGEGTDAMSYSSATGSHLQVDTFTNTVTLNGANSGDIGSFSTANSLPEARAWHRAVTSNGYIYVLGGSNGSTTQSTVYYAKVYADGSTGSWQTNANAMPVATQQAAAVVVNGYLYVIGGTGDGDGVYYAKLNTDGSTGSWQTAYNLPGARSELAAATYNGYIYVLGGAEGSTEYNTVYYGKVNADGSIVAWQTANAMPGVRINHAAVVVNGYLYSLGGHNGSTVQKANYYAKIKADGSLDSWQTSANDMPTDFNYDHAAVTANGYIYTISGRSSNHDNIYRTKVNADGSITSWTTLGGSIPSGTTSDQIGRSAVVVNGYIYAIGGSGSPYQAGVYYASTSRVRVGGSLDLVGVTGTGSLGEGQNGGSLIAGNTMVLGTLDVRDVATFTAGATFGNALTVNGSGLYKDTVDSNKAFQIQNSAGATLFGVDTTNSRTTNGARAVFGNSTNTVSAFQIQNSAGASVLSVDTVNGRVGVGGATIPGAKLHIVNNGGTDNAFAIDHNASGALTYGFTLGGASNDMVESVKRTADGGYIMAGYTSSFSVANDDMLLIKTNASGAVEWTRTLGGANADKAYGVTIASDGGFVMAGTTDSYGSGWTDFLLAKYDASGNHQWTRLVGGSSIENFGNITTTTDNGFVLVGQSSTYTVGGGADVIVVKYNSAGTYQWTRVLGGANADMAEEVQATSDGGVIIAGKTASLGTGGSDDALLAKYDSSGALTWTRTMGGANSDTFYSVQTTSDGGYIASGYTQSYGSGSTDILLAKYNSTGTLQWTRTAGGVLLDSAYGVQQTSDGGYIIAGDTTGFGLGSSEMLIIKYDVNGNQEWTRSFGASGHDYGRGIVQASDGGYALIGYSGGGSFGAAAYDAVLARFDVNGNMANCSTNCGRPSIPGSSISPTVASPTPSTSSPSPVTSSPAPTLVNQTPTSNVTIAALAGSTSVVRVFEVNQLGATSMNGAISMTGSFLFKSDSNSTTAFRIQDASNNTLLTADTQNRTLSLIGRTTIAIDDNTTTIGAANPALNLQNTSNTDGNYNRIWFSDSSNTVYAGIESSVITQAGHQGNISLVVRGAGGYLPQLTVNNAGNLQLHSYGAGTLTTDSSGNVTASSDIRLKNVQGNFDRGLSDLLNIDPILYKWNGLSGLETNDTYAGFSAQNIQVAIPEAVSTDSQGYLTLQDRPILAASVNAIKEVHSATNDLDSRITALEAAIGSSPTFSTLNVTGATTLSSLTVTGNVHIQGKLTVANAQVTGELHVGGHIVSSNTAGNTTAVLGAAAGVGTGGQVVVSGNDTAGTITITTTDAATAPTVDGILANVTFAKVYGKAPRVVLTATDNNGATLSYYVTATTESFSIHAANSSVPAAGTTYTFNYIIIE